MFSIRKQFVLSERLQKMIYEMQRKTDYEESESSIIRRAIEELYNKDVHNS